MTMTLSAMPAWQGYVHAVQATPLRGDRLRIIDAAGIAVDLSTQIDSDALQQAASALLRTQGFERARAALFAGEPVNWTENRAAWHTALRAADPPAAVAAQVLAERERVRRFVRRADTDGLYRSVLHLGIGGSDWGPRMVVQSLQSGPPRRALQFASNVDAHAIDAALRVLDPADTLIIVASKTFTTTEPLANLTIALNWLAAAGVADPLSRVVAVTANEQAALDAGVAPERIFKLWDWVGGRYSVWSSIGLPIALALGSDVLDALLAGAAEMDMHFLNAPQHENAPLQMALVAVANRSVLGYASQALAPYDSRLSNLVPWAQQLEMESLGKTAMRDGSPIDVPISPAIWGMAGTDAQHTFFQWLHQDAKGAPVDFILCRQPDHSHPRNHTLLIANCLAQRAALLLGKPYEQTLEETRGATSGQNATVMARHRMHAGGRPSTLIVLPELNARALGALLALYEHKVFAQAVIWGINPFDQWGVEYGKALAKNIIHELDTPGARLAAQDPSTHYWINAIAGEAAGSARPQRAESAS